jgi:hypothetical protein
MILGFLGLNISAIISRSPSPDQPASFCFLLSGGLGENNRVCRQTFDNKLNLAAMNKAKQILTSMITESLKP